MSINFSQSLALIDRNCKSNAVSYPVSEKTADMNLALDRVFDIIFKSTGRWQFDDSNHSDYPIIMTSLVNGQRDYTFTTDEQGNLILDIYKVMAKNPSGIYYDLDPVDQQSDDDMQSFYDGLNTTGTPTRYDKTANGIFLDAIPSYDSVNGLKVFINREGSYFQESDTTKKAGIAGLYQEYLPLWCSAQYCKRNKMFDLSDRYEKELETIESNIRKNYRDRNRDEVTFIRGEKINPY